MNKGPLLIGICGKAGAGKNFLGGLFAGYQQKAFGTALKEFVSQVYGPIHKDQLILIGGKLVSGRRLLQTVGTDLVREQLDQDFWVRALFNRWDGKEPWVITDVRFLNEVQAIQGRSGVVIWIDGTFERRGLVGEEAQHPSECQLIRPHANFRVDAGDTEGMHQLVKEITASW